MPALVWDETGKKLYETGVDHGALYVVNPVTGLYGTGVAWNGLVSVTEAPSGAETNDQFADNIKYISIRGAETFGGTIEAFTYPPEFEVCDGTASPVAGVGVGQQVRRSFGLAYRSLIGSDTLGTEAGYKLHLLYGLSVSPSDRQYQTINESPEPLNFSWEFSSVPAPVKNMRPTSLLTINSTTVDKTKLTTLETTLFGNTPKLPTPDEVLTTLGLV